MKINEYNQMMKYLTRRKDPKKPDDYIYDGSKGTIRAERDIKEEEINKDPNILRRIKYYSETYDDVKLGKDFDKAIAAEDKNLAALGRAKPNMYERGKMIDGVKKRLANSRAYGYDPKNDKPFTKIANNLGKKKPVKKAARMPLPEIPTPIIDVEFFKKPEADPALDALGKKVFADKARSDAEKNKGLPGILSVDISKILK